MYTLYILDLKLPLNLLCQFKKPYRNKVYKFAGSR